MPVPSLELTRRQVLSGLGASASLLVPSGCTRSASEVASPPPSTAVLAEAVELEDIAHRLLAHEPERATSLGVDAGAHAGLRAALEDQSPLGQDAYAATLRADLERIRGLGVSRLEAYLARLEALPGALDGELERMRATTDMGVTPPDFLLDKATAQLQRTLADAGQGELFEPRLVERDDDRAGASIQGYTDWVDDRSGGDCSRLPARW